MMNASSRDGKNFWASLAFTVAIVGMLAALGFWQLERLHWKTDLIAALKAKDIPAIAMETARVTPSNPEPTLFFGKYRPENAIFIRSGERFMVYMPFQTDDGWMVLMRRGSIPAGDLSGIVLDTKTGTGSISVSGVPLPRPSAVPWIKEPSPDGLLWTLLDWDAVEHKMKKYTLAPRLAPYIVAVTDEPKSALDIEIAPPELRNEHMQYAVFWFGMALVAAVLFSRFLLLAPRREKI